MYDMTQLQTNISENTTHSYPQNIKKLWIIFVLYLHFGIQWYYINIHKKVDLYMEILTIILAVILLYFIGIGAYTTNNVLYPKMKTDEYFEDIRNKYNSYEKKWYEDLGKEEFKIKSRYGYDINFTYIPNDTPSEHTIIICHGVTVRSEAVIKYLNMFLKNGYNALFIDHRAHGKTGGKHVSYGYYEKYDLQTAIKWVKDNHTGKIGLIGESMGAGICMQTVAIEKVDFLIEDCGYSSFEEELKHQYRGSRLSPVYPAFWITRLFIRLVARYDLKKVSPVEALKQVDIPILVVHGQEDDYVPFYMASTIYESIKSKDKMMYVAKGTKHALSYEDHPIEYQNKVYEFLKGADMPCSKDFTA